MMAADIADTLIIRKSICREPKQSNNLKVSSHKPNERDEAFKMDPNLHLNEVQNIIKSKFIKNGKEILKAFQSFDIDGTGVVTKGELRRILDLYCIPLTTNQYESFLSSNTICSLNGSVNYDELFDKIQAHCESLMSGDNKCVKLPQLQRSATTLCFQRNHSNIQPMSRQSSGNGLRTQMSSRGRTGSVSSKQSSRCWNYTSYNIDEIIPILQMQIARNPAAIMKAFKLFDFNSDNHIQRHRLRKVLENFCFPLTDKQFDKLMGRFSYSQNGNVNYVDLMKNIGIPIDSKGIIQNKNNETSNDKVVERQSLEQIHILKLALTERGLLGSSELEDLLIIFRKKIEEQFSSIRKTFLVMDPSASGFVTLDILHNILNQFVFPMSLNVFRQLMEKCAFKATGKIVWLQFLQKFQDPQSKHLNGSTIAIKSDLKCNPIQGVGQKGQIDELLELLYKYINNNYISFRDAFLQINQTHKGKIPKSEFIKILNRFNFRIQPDQLNVILSFLDPNNRGFISYHHFLELFEQKENLSSHKWLNSNHKVYEPKKDLKLSSETLKATLTENITKKWPSVIHEFKSIDSCGNGFVTVSDLKKVLMKLFDYLKEDDIDRFTVHLTLKDKFGRINYLELLNLLGVDTSPTDLDGLSTQIAEANDLQMKERHEDHVEKMNLMNKNAEARVSFMSLEELVIRIKDRILQKRSNFFEIFKKFECPDKKGGINKRQLKKILNEFGFSLSNEQFGQLCEFMNFPTNSRLDFNGFSTLFLDNRECSDDLNNDLCFLPKSNHHVNDIRGEDCRKMNIEEVEELLRQKIVNNFSDLKTAFHKFDTNNKGYLTKSDFRNFLNMFLVTVDESHFDSLCEKLELTKTSKLTYNDFLDRFQIRDDLVDGHKWLISKHKFNEPSTSSVPEMTADEVFSLLPNKIYQYFHDISPTFVNLVTNGTGFIKFKNLLLLLSKLQINMTKAEARKLWKKYDIHNRNKLDFHDFIYNMGLLEHFSCGDTCGPSALIIQNSHDALVNHLANQEDKHQKCVDNQALLGNHLHVEHLFEIVKRHLRVTYSDTSSAFKAITQKKSLTCEFSLEDLNHLLSQIHIFVTNEKFVQLAARMGFEGPEDSLSYDKFCSIFQDKISIGGQEKPVGSIVHNCDLDTPSKIIIEEAGNLNNNQIVSVISRRINEQLSDIEKTFHVMDPKNTGYVTTNEFRNLLFGFCLNLTDKQFKHYLHSLSPYVDKSDGTHEKFDYRYFLKSFGQKDAEYLLANAEVSAIGMTIANSKKITFQEATEYIYECIKARPNLFLKSFRLKDSASQNVVVKSDFRSVIDQHCLTLSNEDFEKFWSSQPRRDANTIEYVEFIKKVSNYSESCDIKASKLATKDENPEEVLRIGTIDEEDADEMTRSILEKVLNKHWQNIFNKCKAIDQSINDNQAVEGSIPLDDFIGILSEFDHSISSEKLMQLNLYKTCKRGKNIRYGDLIRSIVLSSRGSLISQENAADVLKKFTNVGIKTANSDSSKDYFPHLFKLRRQVLDHWKSLRKQFTQNDKKQNGTVCGNVFMSIMKTVCGQLSAELFYHLMKLYDYDGTGDFHYKKFIEDFLKTA